MFDVSAGRRWHCSCSESTLLIINGELWRGNIAVWIELHGATVQGSCVFRPRPTV